MVSIMIKKTLSDIEISSFCMEVAMLLHAGMPLEEGLYIMEEEERTSSQKSLLKEVHESISKGMTLHDALAKCGVFPEYVVNMVLIGEKTGKLEDILRELNVYYESKNELTSNLKSAVVYPFIMAIMMSVVLLVLSLKVLPMFSQIYYELGSGIPTSVIIVTKFGKWISIVLAAILIVIIVVSSLIMIHKKWNPNEKILFLKASILEKNKILLLIAKARFTSVMVLAFSSGIEIGYAMDLAEKLIEYPFMKEKIRTSKMRIEKGESFPEVLREAGIFDGMNAGLVSTGFRSGNVEEAMKFVERRYNDEAQKKIEEMVSAIEPILVITMSVLVGIILLIVMMPLLGIMSTIG